MRLIFLIEQFFDVLFGRKYFLRSEDIEVLREINPDADKITDGFFKAISNVTVLGIIATGFPVALYFWGWYKENMNLQHAALKIAFAFALNLGTTYLLKIYTHRVRPYIKYPDLNEKALENTPSFPSGHSSVAFQTATAIAFAFPYWQVAMPFYLWASTIAFSRLYLGVHYPSDVVVGVMLGFMFAFLVHIFYV
jgi:membrane-associated phospholipid phosphatase